MCSNYLWLLIGIIIVCSCLVIYGSSSTTIKEGMSPLANGTCPHGWCLNACGGCSPREESCGLGSNKWCDCHTKDSCTCTECPRGEGDCKRVGHAGGAPGTIVSTDPPKATGPNCESPTPACCDRWVQTLGCQGDGPIDTGTAYKLDHTGKGFCTTTINPGSSGYCLCADGSKRNMVNCGHEPFVCEDICKPYCNPSPSPPPAPPPPPPSCAAFLSHNDCPAGTTSKPANTQCSVGGAPLVAGTNPWDCANSLAPKNIGTCWGNTATSKCPDMDGQSAYNQIQHLPTAGTSHCELPNPSDCEPERGYSDGGKQAYALYQQICFGKEGSAICPSSSCCTPNPQCSSLGSCPTYSNMPNGNLVCQGQVCDSTVGGECCKPNPTCSADVCDPDTQIFTGAGTQCVGPTCTQTECCKPRARCNEGVQCNPDLYDKTSDYNSKYCKGLVCELSECCIPDPTCHAYPCPTYYTDKPNKSKIKCGVGEVCNTDQCCDLNPTCSSYFTGAKGVAKNGGCPTNDHLKKNAAQIRCLESDCTTAECCGVDNKCSTFNCAENNFYHTYSHIPNAEGSYCNNDLCTQEQCCAATPTYALPEVETWPLYPENYQ